MIRIPILTATIATVLMSCSPSESDTPPPVAKKYHGPEYFMGHQKRSHDMAELCYYTKRHMSAAEHREIALEIKSHYRADRIFISGYADASEARAASNDYVYRYIYHVNRGASEIKRLKRSSFAFGRNPWSGQPRLSQLTYNRARAVFNDLLAIDGNSLSSAAYDREEAKVATRHKLNVEDLSFIKSLFY